MYTRISSSISSYVPYLSTSCERKSHCTLPSGYKVFLITSSSPCLHFTIQRVIRHYRSVLGSIFLLLFSFLLFLFLQSSSSPSFAIFFFLLHQLLEQRIVRVCVAKTRGYMRQTGIKFLIISIVHKKKRKELTRRKRSDKK